MIRRIEEKDRALFLAMMDEFYHSPAVLHPIDPACYERGFEELISGGPYLDGYILEYAGEAAGYAILAKTFSTEVGGKVIWVEEVYVRPDFQGKGIGKQFFAYIQSAYAGAARLRLEAEPDNERAIALYERLGFEKLEYLQMIKDRKE